jgi:hypothetical protein
MKKFILISVLLVSVFLFSACGSVQGTIMIEGRVTGLDDGTITLENGTRITAVEDMVLNGDDGTQLHLVAGQSAVAVGQVILDPAGAYIGTFDIASEVPASTEEPVAEATEEPVDTEEPAETESSWICYTQTDTLFGYGENQDEASLTYRQLMDSNPDRVEYQVEDIADCPFDSTAEDTFFHWTQYNPHADELGDTQGWFRQGNQQNVLDECALQDGWCLVTND